MNFDRNSVIGFIILAVLFFGYFYYTNEEQAAYNKAKARQQFVSDSTAKANRPKVDSAALLIESQRVDSLNRVASAGYFSATASAASQVVTLENKLMKVSFSTKGAQVADVQLTGFRQHDDTGFVVLAKGMYNQISYAINTGNNKTAQTADLIFTPAAVTTQPDGSKTLRMSLVAADSASPVSLVHVYTIRPDSYLIDFSIEVQGAERLLTQGVLSLQWQYEAFKQEDDIAYEKQNTQVGFEEGGEFDYFTIGNRTELNFSKPLSWVGLRQRFFFAAIASKTPFTTGQLSWTLPVDSLGVVVRSAAALKLQLPATGTARADLGLYYGPSDYHILKSTPYGFDQIVNLGQGVYAFVRPINKYIIVPIFDFMRSLSGANLGLAIALLTLFIRLVTSPLTYSSYLSGAKMKALRPEISKLKEKFGDDQQSISMEQMKLFREAGALPISVRGRGGADGASRAGGGARARAGRPARAEGALMALGDNDNRPSPDDGVYEALEALDWIGPTVDVQGALTRLRAHGFGTEANVLLGRGDAAWAMLRTLRDALRRMDPAWCDLHGEAQFDDEEFDDLLGTLEDMLEDGP